jgi:uncharacterized damage-inducible protein DinB
MKLRTLSLLCCLLLTAGAVLGQTSSPPAFSANEAAKAGFAEVNDWIVKSADMVPADKYNYKPVDTVRTFGQLIAHVADSYNFFCTRAVGTKFEGTDSEKGATDKETLIPKLKEAVGRCTAAYDSKNADLRPLFGNITHTNLHYGNIITYMRMMGLKPPSS